MYNRWFIIHSIVLRTYLYIPFGIYFQVYPFLSSAWKCFFCAIVSRVLKERKETFFLELSNKNDMNKKRVWSWMIKVTYIERKKKGLELNNEGDVNDLCRETKKVWSWMTKVMSTTYIERRAWAKWQRWCWCWWPSHTHVEFGVEWQRWCWCQWLAPMTYTHKGFGTKQWMWHRWFAQKKGGIKEVQSWMMKVMSMKGKLSYCWNARA
jgi:hypothetical protein